MGIQGKTRCGDTLKAGNPAHPGADGRIRKGCSPVNQASSPGCHKHRIVFQRGGSNREARLWRKTGADLHLSLGEGGTSASEQVTGGADRPDIPARHRGLERVACSVRASQARAARRSNGAWESVLHWTAFTRIVKVGQVSRGENGRWRVVFVWSKAWRATGNARRRRSQASSFGRASVYGTEGSGFNPHASIKMQSRSRRHAKAA